MQIDYTLTGIDAEGNQVLDVAMSAEQAAKILLELVTNGSATVNQQHLGPHNVERVVEGLLVPKDIIDAAATSGKIGKKEKAPKPAKTPGVGRGSARALTQEKKDAIIRLRKEGKSQTEILNELRPIGSATISRVLQEAGLGGRVPKA